jgi:hypothetical protein
MEDPFEREETEAAAAEAAMVGGRTPAPDDPDEDEAMRPVVEAGGGEAEGFEEARDELIEHASHGDQQSAHAVLHDQGLPEEAAPAEGGEPDLERSSEREREQDDWG